MALGDFIRQLLSSDLSCEVDPLRLCNGNASSSGSSSSGSGSSISSQLEKSRQQLTRQVETAWRRILACQHLFPYPLRLLFSGLRHRLEQAGRAELTDNCMHRKILSSSIFLRFLCPAILSPSLFGLVNEYPTGQAARNLTLIAKSLQTLANFTRFGGKEGYMEFMNNFVEREWRNMQHFLRQISAPCARYCQACEAHDSMVDCTIDLGKELSLLASYMREHCDQLMEQRKENFNLNKNSNTTTTLIAIKQLWNSLMTISNWGNNCCDKEEEKEEEGNFGNEEGKKIFKEDNEGGMASTNIEGGHSPGNPPSDYENNNTVITTTTAKVPENLWRQQPPPIPMARRTVMIPQPIEISSRGNLYGGGEGCQPISAPPVPNSPFSEQKTHFSFSSSGNNNNNNSSSYVSTAAVHHLNTSDDYVLSSALSKLRTTTTTTKLLDPPIKQQYWNSNNSSCIHLYDETTSCNNKRGVDNLQQQQQQHLYDEVPTDTNLTILPPPSASRALNAGVVIAHRGVASHEATQRRGELCTPRVIQRNAFRAVDDEADDESESEEDGRVQEIVEENEEVSNRLMGILIYVMT
uniref:Ras-GAP domain-containing protein n=1 Tax=Meloidogyne incognita TaxID=6306 RepID=A0A914NVM4_MELIC